MDVPQRVEFDDDKIRSQMASPSSFGNSTPGVIAFVISHSGGRIKTEEQAQKFLLVCVGIAIVLSIFLFKLKPGTEAKIEVPRGNELIIDGGPPRLAVPVQ